MIAKLWHSYLVKIKSGLRSANIIRLAKDGSISKAAKIKDAVISGKVTIGAGCKVVDGVTLVGQNRISIGEYTSINGPATDIFAAVNTVSVGKFCSIARHVSIQEYNHDFNRLSSYFMFHNIFGEDREKDFSSKGSVVIGNDVWIGAHSVVLSGVTIGDGAVVGANSVVTSDVPPYAIVSGTPARVIRFRFPEEVIAELNALKWWDWPIEKIRRNKAIFQNALTVETLKSIQ